MARYYFDRRINHLLREKKYTWFAALLSARKYHCFSISQKDPRRYRLAYGILAVYCEFSGNGNVVAVDTRAKTDKKRDRARIREKGGKRERGRESVAAYFTRISRHVTFVN